MAILVVLVLIALWAAVLVPPILRSRNDAGAGLGISDVFGRLREGLGHHRGHGGDPSLPPLQPIMGPLGTMGPVGPIGGPSGPMTSPYGPVPGPGAMSPTQRRRRDILVGLLALAGITLVMALFSSGFTFWVLHLLADAALVGYVFLLLQYKARAAGGVEQRERRPRPQVARPGPVLATMPNVHDLTARRFPPATSVTPVEAPREATVLALRRSASW